MATTGQVVRKHDMYVCSHKRDTKTSLIAKSLHDMTAIKAHEIQPSRNLYSKYNFHGVLPARRSASAVFAVERCLAVCLSHAGIVSKRLNLS